MSTAAEAVESVLASRDAGRIAAAREEQREACALAVAASIGPCKRHSHECETDRTADAAVDAVRATPLDATPLADTIRDLRADLATAASVAADLREERDAARHASVEVVKAGRESRAELVKIINQTEAERDDLRARNEELVAALAAAERALTVAVRHACDDMPDFDPGEHVVIKQCRAALSKYRGTR